MHFFTLREETASCSDEMQRQVPLSFFSITRVQYEFKSLVATEQMFLNVFASLASYLVGVRPMS